MTEGKRGAFVGQIDPRLRGRRTHLCAACDFPIAVYGRCAPCLHAYCLSCAASMPQCLICRAWITKLERIPAEAGLFISPLTLQGFRSEADLAKHAQQLDQQLQALMAAGGPIGGSLQQQQQQQQGWKPPPPPLPPGGAGRPQQSQQQQQRRHGVGAVMVPR